MEFNLNLFLVLSAVLFSIGVVGVLVRRNAIVIFMCIELMLNAINLSLVSFSSFLGNESGQIFVFFVLTVAAAEAAVGLAIVISLFRNKETLDIDKINILKW
ncbi:MAG: NADH-quinone oxidoreductase subunit NuoK [Candidatus Kapaibacterium sp.]